MERIESFRINHLTLIPGLYVSRRDKCKDVDVTTFDLRITAPNREPVVDVPALHTIEHLGATFLRNSAQKENTLGLWAAEQAVILLCSESSQVRTFIRLLWKCLILLLASKAKFPVQSRKNAETIQNRI